MILPFEQITSEDLSRVGGKGRNLGMLARAGFPVPPGFCVTTEAFVAFAQGCRELPRLYDALDHLGAEDVGGARRLGAEVRAALLSTPLPAAVAEAAITEWRAVGADHAYAVRSSATAEDLPGASFAGQQDTILNVRGEAALLDAIRRCFASLFTDRAILYRTKNGFGHRGVALSVVVQRMVFPDAAGILFTADPVTGHRGTLAIDAGFGLGEALVSGVVNADLYRVDKASGRLKEVRVGDKAVAIRALPEGGTVTEPLPPAQQEARVLDDEALRRLWQLGRDVEAHYGGEPQDLEWALERGTLFLLQARPITSLFPLPEPRPDDGALHVYLSFSHFQNMIEPISPMGRDVWRIVMPFGKRRITDVPTEQTAAAEAGGRIFLDVTPVLRAPRLRRLLSAMVGFAYSTAGPALAQLAERPEVQAGPPPHRAALLALARLMAPVPARLVRQLVLGRPEELPAWAARFVEEQVAEFRAQVQAAAPGGPRLRAARQAIAGIFQVLPHFVPRLGSGVLALSRLRRRFAGTPHAADVEALQRGLVGNITTEMDLQVGDLADRARAHPALVEALRSSPERAEPDSRAARPVDRLHALRGLDGGPELLAAIARFLDRFGMRGQAEIDIGRPRWIDQPGLLLNSIAGNLARPEAGAHRAHFRRLQAEAEAAGRRLVVAAGGGLAGRWVDRLVRCTRHGLGLREHPKYLIVRCLAELRAAVLESARALRASGRLEAADDVWFLRYDELLALVEDPAAADVRPRIAARKEEHARFRHLTPPLVVTSEGEVPRPPPPKDLPPGALAGIAASAGVVEGVARVVLDPADQVLQAGEILVAPYTDPGWTPLFVHAAGLVCDIGGMMTHGSVVAREYGIPAVVGVGEGTRRIRSGQRLRVDGSRGLVTVLPGDSDGK